MKDIVETVAEEIVDIPGDPSALEIARIAIEAYQRALWTPHFDHRAPCYPEHRRNRANQMTAHIMSIISKYLRDDAEVEGHRDAARDLFEAIYESGVEVITDADRATAGLPPRGAYGLTREQLRIWDAKLTEAMLRPLPSILVPAESFTHAQRSP